MEQRQNAIVGIINLTCYFRRLVTVRECCVISGQGDGLTDEVGAGEVQNELRCDGTIERCSSGETDVSQTIQTVKLA